MFLERIFKLVFARQWRVEWKASRKESFVSSGASGRQVTVKEDSSVRLCSKSWVFWLFR